MDFVRRILESEIGPSNLSNKIILSSFIPHILASEFSLLKLSNLQMYSLNSEDVSTEN